MRPVLVRALAAGAGLAVVGGLGVAAVAATHPAPARLAADPAPSAAPSIAPSGATPPASPTPTSTGFATLPPDQWPTPDVPDSVAVRRSGRTGATSGAESPARVRPVEVRIPAIGVDSRLVDLGIAADGTMEVPVDPDRAGWLTTAPAPGQLGPAVIAGHVDTREGPAVFARLHELGPGDRIEVVRQDGEVVRFTVRSLRSVPKDRFPTDLVYGPAVGPELRLITCSGTVDPVSGHYRDNTVVFAS
ncbi:class F sortase [Phycicoccus flavus]|uniref:class F sortase n=1 Tax=Phycicoccus flavus TaxID=2502783 RepID=UPI000FEBDB50|nr:class F sortase [Phycicoccus flavus]NHA67907.1 class F sortase [Phycicoccus flavus]